MVKKNKENNFNIVYINYDFIRKFYITTTKRFNIIGAMLRV